MIRVAVIDSHCVARVGLRSFLANQIDLKIVVEGADSAAAIDVARRGRADVIVLCLSSRQAVVSALESVRALDASLPVLVLWPTIEDSTARVMFEKGAHCLMDKACNAAQIAEGIRALHQRRRCCATPCLQPAALATVLATPRHGALSAREYAVFLRLAQGAAVGVIATEMAISLKTVSTFRTRLLKKMGVASNSELTRYAVTNGLFEYRPLPAVPADAKRKPRALPDGAREVAHHVALNA